VAGPPPLERMVGIPDPQDGLIAGDRETADIFSLSTPVLRASLHTSKGVGYKDVNEDGGALFRDEAGHLYLGVFDQAGGMGLGSRDRGAASAIAARCFFEHAKALASRPDTDVAGALRTAALAAHHEIRKRGHEEATTFIAGRITHDEAVFLCVGDSGAMHFKRDGRHVQQTEKHRLPPPLPQNILTDALGQTGGEPTTDAYRWRLEPGDLIVIGSDGLLDSALSTQDFGEIVAALPNPADATRDLRAKVYQQMGERRAKSDNITIIVVQVTPGATSPGARRSG
jgi:serine/threonine protein phosphatase PrpC